MNELLLGSSILAFPLAIYFIVKSLYHLVKVIRNIKRDQAIFLGPLLLFMPWQFEDEGNRHRIKFINSFSWAMLTSFLTMTGSILARYLQG